MATVKRKRGRPRRVELRGDFDISLIREFEKRPELYDRNSIHFRDKNFQDELWEELSHQLGYNSNIVKDRMLQLRNRYHIEKRRIENMQAECPNRHVESKWPLYEEMSFLSDHIPVRRSYRTMKTKRPYGEYHSVKNEHGTDDSDGEPKDEGGSDYVPGARKGSIQVRSFGKLISSNAERNGTNGHYPSAMHTNVYARGNQRYARMPRQVHAPNHTQGMYQRSGPPKVISLPPGADKFVAFGQFLTSSLLELPENEALLLVNQFTSELVQSCLKKHDQTLPEEEDLEDILMEINGHDSEAQEG